MSALKQLSSASEVSSFLSSNRHALICFSATWCGPCQRSKPELEALAQSYADDATLDVVVGLAYEDGLGPDVLAQYSITAFPTYVLFKAQKEAGRVTGVNFDGVRQMIAGANCVGAGPGHSLGGGDAGAVSPEEARALRLAKLGSGATTPAAEVKKEEEKEKEEEAMVTEAVKEEEEKAEKDVEMTDAAPTEPTFDPEVLKNLTESMGFSELRAKKGLLYGNGGTMEGAIEWLMEHQDDDDIDDPISVCPPAKSGGGDGEAKSYKCNECGKILSNMANLELHANKTGHSDFEESTEAVTPLTAEEKAQKVEELKALLKAKRAEREEAEKSDNIDREKQRRFMGKEMAKTREEMEREQRKREASQRRREKDDFKRERERLRAELAKDKAERISNKGKLSSKLGVDGYNPDAIQYDVPAEGHQQDTDESAATEKKRKASASASKLDEYIAKVSAYRAGGDGGRCLKVLLAYVKNAAENPDDDKFRSINMENKAYKGRVKPFLGAKNLLLAVGFEPEGDFLLLRQYNAELLQETRTKLEAALTAYGA